MLRMRVYTPEQPDKIMSYAWRQILVPWKTLERQTPEKQTHERQTPEKQTHERQTPERQTPERETPDKTNSWKYKLLKDKLLKLWNFSLNEIW